MYALCTLCLQFSVWGRPVALQVVQFLPNTSSGVLAEVQQVFLRRLCQPGCELMLCGFVCSDRPVAAH
jgi:hypothetical protein